VDDERFWLPLEEADEGGRAARSFRPVGREAPPPLAGRGAVEERDGVRDAHQDLHEDVVRDRLHLRTIARVLIRIGWPGCFFFLPSYMYACVCSGFLDNLPRVLFNFYLNSSLNLGTVISVLTERFTSLTCFFGIILSMYIYVPTYMLSVAYKSPCPKVSPKLSEPPFRRRLGFLGSWGRLLI
jgi:hypothetical protein